MTIKASARVALTYQYGWKCPNKRTNTSQIPVQLYYFNDYTLILLEVDPLRCEFPIEGFASKLMCDYGIAPDSAIILCQIEKLPEIWEVVYFCAWDGKSLKYPVWHGIDCPTAAAMREGRVIPDYYLAATKTKKCLTRRETGQTNQLKTNLNLTRI